MRAVAILGNPGIDGLSRDLAVGTVRLFLLQTARDLFGSLLARQSSADIFVEFGIIHFAYQRTLAAPPFRFLLSLASEVIVRHSIASQFTTNHGRSASDRQGNFLLVGALIQQLRYAVGFFQRKMAWHRWDFVPKGKVCKTSPLGNSERRFLQHQLSVPSFVGDRLHLRFETANCELRQ